MNGLPGSRSLYAVQPAAGCRLSALQRQGSGSGMNCARKKTVACLYQKRVPLDTTSPADL